MNNNDFIEEILVTTEEIEKITAKLGQQITSDFNGEDVVFLVVLNGAFMFATDLIKNVNVDCCIDFVQCSTYGNSADSSGNFVMKKDVSMDIKGKNVVIVEDILDSGFTLKKLCEHIEKSEPKTLKIATMIDKPARRKENVTADYVGMVMKHDLFIVGYGLDYAQKYRNLPFIGILKKEIYA